MTLTKYRVCLVKDSSERRDGEAIFNQEQIIRLAEDMKTLDREELRCYFLNARHKLIGYETVSVGTLTASLAHPREIFKGAILANCAGFILVHNHPSGECAPSEEDKRLTQRIREAANIIGIEFLDHIIVAESGSYSFKTVGSL